MSRSKPLYVFSLVAALIFSQLAASIHVTGHFGELEYTERERNHAGIHFSENLADSAISVALASEHGAAHKHPHQSRYPEAHAEHHTAGHEENVVDCEIFHLLLNLNGGFLLTQQNSCAPKQRGFVQNVVHLFATHGAPDNYRIRAPPAIS